MAGPHRRGDEGASGGPPADGRAPDRGDCPASRAIGLVAHKWTVQILFTLNLAAQPVRFRKLQQAIEPITQKELTKRLRELERSGLVHRRVYAEVPPRVEYRLTELGMTLIPALTALSGWAARYGPEVDDHRRRVDAGRPGLAASEDGAISGPD
jgi:DNA-binding HxlR family transcriptional regulator